MKSIFLEHAKKRWEVHCHECEQPIKEEHYQNGRCQNTYASGTNQCEGKFGYFTAEHVLFWAGFWSLSLVFSLMVGPGVLIFKASVYDSYNIFLLSNDFIFWILFSLFLLIGFCWWEHVHIKHKRKEFANIKLKIKM